MAEPSQAKPSQDPEQRPRERPGARGQQGGHRRLLCTKVAGTGQPLAFGSEGGREALGGLRCGWSRSSGLPRHRRAGGSSEGSHTNDQRHGETDF